MKRIFSSLTVFMEDGTYVLTAEYAPDRYTGRMIVSFLEFFAQAAGQLLTAESLDEIDLMTDRAQQLLDTVNDTAWPVNYRPAHCLLEESAEKFPDRLAVVTPSEKLSYSELNARANRAAHCMMDLGVAPGQIVALMLPRCASVYITRQGILKAGGAFLSIAPDYPDDRESLGTVLFDSLFWQYRAIRPGDSQVRHFEQRRYNRICEGFHLFVRLQLIRHHNRRHTGGLCGTDPVIRILDHDTVFRICLDPLGSFQEDIRIRLASKHLITADNRIKKTQNTGFTEFAPNNFCLCGRRNGRPDSGDFQPVQKLNHTRLHFELSCPVFFHEKTNRCLPESGDKVRIMVCFKKNTLRHADGYANTPMAGLDNVLHSQNSCHFPAAVYIKTFRVKDHTVHVKNIALHPTNRCLAATLPGKLHGERAHHLRNFPTAAGKPIIHPFPKHTHDSADDIEPQIT